MRYNYIVTNVPIVVAPATAIGSAIGARARYVTEGGPFFLWDVIGYLNFRNKAIFGIIEEFWTVVLICNASLK